MVRSHFEITPYSLPPNKTPPPKAFDDIDIYPAVTITAPRRTVQTFGNVVQREDELGPCLVVHFEVRGTLLLFYQSALDPKDHWTIFVDMNGCVAQKQFPTKLGSTALGYLSSWKIRPNWINLEADTEYRSRRSKLAWRNRSLRSK